MKKSVLIVGLISILMANSANVFLDYTNKLVYYHFDLKGFDKIYPPFERKKTTINLNNRLISTNSQVLIKSIRIIPLAIFNKEAEIMVNEYLGDQLIKSYKKWVSVNSRIDECTVTNITDSKIFMKCKNKTIVKSLNKKIPGLKELK